MATKISQLEQNGDTLYPVTKTNCVYNNNNQNVDDLLATKADKDASNLSASDISAWQTALGSGSGTTWVKLWTNPNPNGNWNTTTIQQDFRDYDYLIILYRNSIVGAGYVTYMSDAIIDVNRLINTNNLYSTFITHDPRYTTPQNLVEILSKLSVNSSNGYLTINQAFYSVDSAPTSLVYTNSFMVPIQILGVKL